MRSLHALVRKIERIAEFANSIDRRVNNMFREGKVVETFPEEGMIRVEFSDGFRSKKIPGTTTAGQIKIWNPHSVGERVVVVSPTGDPGVGMVMPGGFSDENPQNGNQNGNYRVTIGDAEISVTGESISIMKGGVGIVIDASGTHHVGGQVDHDGKNIGKDHEHIGVEPGPALTGPPA